MTPRLRFSPSPTGYFHVGSARSALFNWLEARRTGGQFILRIEDTDTERNDETFVLGIHDAMKWLGLDWDEYYRQSERGPLYTAAIERLVSDGKAYFCDCTRPDVIARTGSEQKGYDRFCSTRGLDAAPGRALRFRVPEGGSTTVVDLIRGEPEFDHTQIEDFVLARGDGSPLFILANVVDDIDMRITHVVRGEDHLPNTPKYILLWQALGGADLPVFAHLPMLVNEKRQKLSKRRDPVRLEDYRDEGYTFQAVRNYLCLLGWAPGDDREFITVEEMIAEFRLENVNSSPAFFDVKKLRHFNAHYLREMSVPEFVAAAGPFLEAGPWAPGDFDFDVFDRIAPEVQTRVEVLSEVPGYIDFLFLAEPQFDEGAFAKHVATDTGKAVLDGVITAYETCEWESGDETTGIQGATWAVGEGLGLNKKKTQFPVRVAVTGRAIGPPLFESLEILGRDAALARLQAARDRAG